MKDVYISKYDAVKTVEKECKIFCPTKMCKLTEYIENAIEEAPVADVQPVRHGRWEYYKNNGIINTYICTNCQSKVEMAIDVEPSKFKYCPNCGARMDGESNG